MKNAKKSKRRYRKQIWLVGSSCALASLMVLANYLLNHRLKNRMIVEHGIRYFKNVSHGMMIVCLVTTGIFFLTVGWSLWLLYRDVARKRQESEQEQQQKRFIAEYAKHSDDAELTRARLQQARREMPAFTEIFERCDEQLEQIAKLQAKQQRLIVNNAASYLETNTQAFAEAEDAICKSFQEILNLCNEADSMEDLNTDRTTEIFAQNAALLERVKSLLGTATRQVNAYNKRGQRDAASTVEYWDSTIRQSMGEGEKDEKQF